MAFEPCPFCSQIYNPTEGGHKRTCCGDPECVRLRHNQNQRAWHKTPRGQVAAAKGQAKQRARRPPPPVRAVCEHCRGEFSRVYWGKLGPYCTSACKWDDALLDHLLAMDASENLLREFGFERIDRLQVQVGPSGTFAEGFGWNSSGPKSDFSE